MESPGRPKGADAEEGAGNLGLHQGKGLGQGGELCMKNPNLIVMQLSSLEDLQVQ